MPTLRIYELSKKRSVNPVLLCRISRFPSDVCATIRYHFSDGSYDFKFPSSWVAPAIADEVRKFVELVNSPHWLESIQPCMAYHDVAPELFECPEDLPF